MSRMVLIVDWARKIALNYAGKKGVPRSAKTYRGARRNAYWKRDKEPK